VVDPSAEAALVERARSSSLAERREQCGQVEAAARPDAEARRQAINHDLKTIDKLGAGRRARKTGVRAP
jgi:hypothetical protein